MEPGGWESISQKERLNVITSYSIHYTKLYDEKAPSAVLDVEIYSEHDIAGSMGALYKGYGYAPDFTITHLV